MVGIPGRVGLIYTNFDKSSYRRTSQIFTIRVPDALNKTTIRKLY